MKRRRTSRRDSRSDRLLGKEQPFKRYAIVQRLYNQCSCAAARARPTVQQISFQRSPLARIRTIFASTGSSHAAQPSVASIRLMAAADGGGGRIGSGVWPTRSPNSTNIVGQVLK